jgi:hypothetical protein
LDKPRKSIDLPWPAIAAALVAVGGVFLYLNPLQTSRPAEQTGLHLGFNHLQDVDARLWQDPLRTTAEHETLVQEQKDAGRNVEDSLHAVETFREKLSSPSYWVLAVMIQGGPYAEYSESRLRTRQAVLEALGKQSYVPQDGEHIGYIKIDKPEWDWHNMIVPFEWCERNVHKAVENFYPFELPDRICVLWLRDEEFKDRPLFQLDWLLRNPTALGINTANTKVRVIGPRTSTTLLEMMRDAAEYKESRSCLPHVEMWCATATASNELLLHEINQSEDQTVEEYFQKKMASAEHSEPFVFRRCTSTDRDVIQRLVKELRTKRDVRLNGQEDEDDHIALISEWDTFYGRALPVTFEREVSGMPLNQLLNGKHPKNILIYHYLRGIDGMLPTNVEGGQKLIAHGVSVADNAKTEEEKKQSSRAREVTEGLNQADYLRRLARVLVDQNEEFRRQRKKEIKAVGVLGSDVYDKLLVMEALRDALPNAIFFTNPLDARLAHPDEWRWTRNLLVGSPFGLTLRKQYQDVPPFRENDQTAFYTATLLAAGHTARADFLNDKAVLRPVRLYEIGRNRAFDLTVVPALQKDDPPTIQPPSPDIQRWWTMQRLLFTGGIIFFIACGLAWALSMVVGHPHLGAKELWYQQEDSLADRPSKSVRARQQARTGARYRLRSAWAWLHWQFFRRNRSVTRVLSSSWSMFAILAIVSIVVVWAICRLGELGDPDGEPYSWNEGISIWPTETLRLLVFLLSIFYILKSSRALHRNEVQIQLHFFCCVQDREPEQKHPLFSKLWWRELAKKVTVRHWKCEENHRVIAANLWSRYLQSGREKARFWRITPLIVSYIAAGVLLMVLLGWPFVPARGAWAQKWDFFFFVCAIAGSMFLTFYVADVTLLNRRLIHYLTKGVTRWPEKAVASLRGRWRLSEQVVASEPIIKFVRLFHKIARPVELPPTELLVDYLDIDLIARRTQIVGDFIYYPFVVISLLIISRSGIFDHWTWALPLLILLGFNAGYAAFSAIYLRRTAERARQSALQRLSDRLIAYTAAGHGDDKEAKTIREATRLIQNEDRGAFAALSQQPLAAALLLPSGSAGIWALLQFFPRLFSG